MFFYFCCVGDAFLMQLGIWVCGSDEKHVVLAFSIKSSESFDSYEVVYGDSDDDIT